MIVDLLQTINIVKLNCEANPIINFIYNKFKFPGVILFKLIIAITPFFTGWLSCLLLISYIWIIVHNYNGLKELLDGEQ